MDRSGLSGQSPIHSGYWQQKGNPPIEMDKSNKQAYFYTVAKFITCYSDRSCLRLQESLSSVRDSRTRTQSKRT